MLKRIFCISLTVSVCLLIAGAILVPLAMKATVDRGLELISTYYREGTATNSQPLKEGQKLVIQADNMEVSLSPSRSGNVWARYRMFGSNDVSVEFAPGEESVLSLTAVQKDLNLSEDDRIKALMDATQWRGRLSVYIPEGVEYEIIGTPYQIYDWNMRSETEVEMVDEVIAVDRAVLEMEEDSWEEQGYIQLKADIFRLMEEYPYEYTIRNKGDSVQFQMGKTNFEVGEELDYVLIGDGFIEITPEAISIDGNYYEIPDDNIKISSSSVTVGRYTFMP